MLRALSSAYNSSFIKSPQPSANTDFKIISASSLGMEIGKGSQKNVYLSLDNHDRCISIFRSDTVGHLFSPQETAVREIALYKQLEKLVFPVVKTHAIVIVDGKEFGIEQELIKGAINSSDMINGIQNIPTTFSFNQNLLTSCNTLIELLKTNNIYIDDLQFLLSETGELFISDPRDIYLSPPDKNIDIVKNIRSYALNNLLDENDD